MKLETYWISRKRETYEITIENIFCREDDNRGRGNDLNVLRTSGQREVDIFRKHEVTPIRRGYFVRRPLAFVRIHSGRIVPR